MSRKFLVTPFTPKYEWQCDTEEIEFDELVSMHEDGYSFEFEDAGEEEIFFEMYDAL